MHRALPLAIAALLGAAIAAAAAAQEPQKPQEQGQQPPGNPTEAFIKQHDTDGDGKVSQTEAVAPQGGRFKETDANGDGSISVDELRQSFTARVPPEAQQKLKERGLPDLAETVLKKLDKSGDGKVDQGEYQQPTVDGFKRMDGDGDGFATLDEADAFFGQMRERIRQMQEQQRGQQPAPAPVPPPVPAQ